jgi:hypothetical protein
VFRRAGGDRACAWRSRLPPRDGDPSLLSNRIDDNRM